MVAMKKIPSVISKYPFHSHHARFRGWILHPYIPFVVKVWLVLLVMAVLGGKFFSAVFTFTSFVVLPFILLSTQPDKGDAVIIFDDCIETICDGEKKTFYWKNIVQRNGHQWDVWQNREPGPNEGFKIFFRFEYEDEHQIVDLTCYLLPRGKHVLRFKDIGYLRNMFLRSLITARPELRVDPVLYDYCETSPVDLSRTKKTNNLFTLIIGGSILIGAAAMTALIPYLDMESILSSTLLIMFATGVLTVGCFCLGTYLLRNHFIDPEDPKVREQRLSYIASNKLISKKKS